MQQPFPSLLFLSTIAIVVVIAERLFWLKGPRKYWSATRLLAIGLSTGAVVGFFIGGIGARIIMRIIAIADGQASFGAITESAGIVGTITLEGTLGILFAGADIGLIGGLLYILIRRWIPGVGIWKGLAFGMILLLLFGGVNIASTRLDFTLFGHPLMTVGMFAIIFILFGLILTLLVERFGPYVPPTSARRWVTIGGYVILGASCLYGLIYQVMELQYVLVAALSR